MTHFRRVRYQDKSSLKILVAGDKGSPQTLSQRLYKRMRGSFIVWP